MERQQNLGESPEQSKTSRQASNLFHAAYTDALEHGASVSDALEAAIAMGTWMGSMGKLDPNGNLTFPLPDQNTDPQP